MNAKVIEGLKQMGTCPDALAWVMTHKNAKSAWLVCDRADWMMWLLGKTVKRNSQEHKNLVLLACRMAGDAQHCPTQPIPEALRAIQLARAWTRSKTTLAKVRAAVRSADDIWDVLICNIVWAAVEAARSVWVPTRAGDAAWFAAGTPAGGAREDRKLKLYAKWVRASFPNPPRLLRGDACTK